MDKNHPLIEGQVMTDREMLRHVLDSILRVEKRLDDHITEENVTLGKIREEMAGNRVKWAALTSVVAVTVSGAVAIGFKHLT
jgi:hypothetical protein